MTSKHPPLHAPGSLSDDESQPLWTSQSQETGNWIFDGIASGVLGAAVIALFFLMIDVANGRPLWTPAALGSAIFLGEPLEVGADPTYALVVGYTMLHGAAFVSIGLMASFVLGFLSRLGPSTGLAVAGALFLGFEAFFLTFIGMMAPQFLEAFGVGRIAMANLIAAAFMAALLVRRPFQRRVKS
jgi:hypothetical protein